MDNDASEPLTNERHQRKLNDKYMGKRRLTRRQAWRIKKIQDERADRAQKREDHDEHALLDGELGPEQEGLVISHFGVQVDIEALSGDNQGNIFRCHMRANLDPIVTGDHIVWRAGKDLSGIIVANVARNNALARPDNHGNLKAIAANIDDIIIVIAPEPRPHANLIDRYLAASEATGITPVILLNKTDLVTEEMEASIGELLDIYPTLDYRIIRASTHNKDGLDELQDFLKTRTTVFVGQSGVGKSSLIKELLNLDSIRVGELSAAARKGRHTTTTARLYHFPEGGCLIDSPGIREFGLWHMNQQQLVESFVEFQPFLGLCKFRNCMHEHEPACAVLDAVDNGKISQRRLNSYRSILASIEEE